MRKTYTTERERINGRRENKFGKICWYPKNVANTISDHILLNCILNNILPLSQYDNIWEMSFFFSLNEMSMGYTEKRV